MSKKERKVSIFSATSAGYLTGEFVKTPCEGEGLIAVRNQYDGGKKVIIFQGEWTTQNQIILPKEEGAVMLSSFHQCIDTLILFLQILCSIFSLFS